MRHLQEKGKANKSAHPHGLFEHRKFCKIREGMRQSENEASLSIFQISKLSLPVLPHVAVPIGRESGRTSRVHSLLGIIASFSEMQTASSIPSPTINPTPFSESSHFQVAIIRKPRPTRTCPGSKIDWQAGSIWQTYLK